MTDVGVDGRGDLEYMYLDEKEYVGFIYFPSNYNLQAVFAAVAFNLTEIHDKNVHIAQIASKLKHFSCEIRMGQNTVMVCRWPVVILRLGFPSQVMVPV